MRAKALYHLGRADTWLHWLLSKWAGLDESERALGRQAVRSHLAMARALRT